MMSRFLSFIALIMFFSLSIGSARAAIFVSFNGESEGVVTMIDVNGDGVNDVEATCFENDLIDPTSGNVVGTGLDCLRDIEVDPDGGITLTSNIFFTFNGSTIASEGTTTVQPLLVQSALDAGFTNGTGSIALGNTITFGTGEFEGATGNARLSGLVNLANFPETAFFDCLFEIDLDGDADEGITGGGTEAIAVKFFGTSDGELMMIDPNNDGNLVESLCFENDLIDPSTEQVIGQGLDCLREITEVDGGLTLVSNVFFTMNTSLGTGTLSSEGMTTVQPLLTEEALEAGFTNMTQSVSNSSEAITFGTGGFANVIGGTTRLSGLVDLATFPNDTTFNCLFIMKPIFQGSGGSSSSSCSIASSVTASSGAANTLILLLPLLGVYATRLIRRRRASS